MTVRRNIEPRRERILLILVGFLFLFASCKEEIALPEPNGNITFQVPDHFPPQWYQFGKNELSSEGISLGRKLFYDPMLSKNGTVSCGTCHIQSSGFSDPGKRFSLGTKGKPGSRNSTALANMAWMPSFMADGGINHIEVMPIAPLTDSLEMDEDLKGILMKLNANSEYRALFKAAFNQDSITDQKVLYAMAQFMSAMISASSKYDKVFKGLEHFTPTEERGYTLFKTNCSSCHREPLLTDFSFRNNGLDSISADPGRARITLRGEDHGKFKVPGLRNIELTGPYMHDGRFNSLLEVVNHYNEGLSTPANLDDSLKIPMNLSVQDKQDLLAFLKTLTDYEYITNTQLSDPNQ